MFARLCKHFACVRQIVIVFFANFSITCNPNITSDEWSSRRPVFLLDASKKPCAVDAEYILLLAVRPKKIVKTTAWLRGEIQFRRLAGWNTKFQASHVVRLER